MSNTLRAPRAAPELLVTPAAQKAASGSTPKVKAGTMALPLPSAAGTAGRAAEFHAYILAPTVRIIEPKALSKHGLTKDVLKARGAREEKEVMSDFIAFVESMRRAAVVEEGDEVHVIFVAHNSEYDKAVVADAVNRHLLSFTRPWPTWECTKEMSRRKYKGNRELRHRLADCCGRAGIEIEDAHTAIGDARMVAKLYPHVAPA